MYLNPHAAHVDNLIPPIIRQIDDVIHLDGNRELLQGQLQRIKYVLQDISSAFEHQNRAPPESIIYCLERMMDTISEATVLLHRSHGESRCLICFFCKPRIPTQIREWNTRLDQLIQELQCDFSVFVNAHQIVDSSLSAQQIILKPVPDSGFVGSGIADGEAQLQMWLMGPPQIRVIGVCGMAGVGKTSLLKKVYNSYKVSNVFDVVIWLTVSKYYIISNLQDCIAHAINLDLSNSSDAEIRKMMLYASLRKKNFLLILDDIWSELHPQSEGELDLLEEVGVAFGADKGSKVVLSTRDRNLVLMNAQKSIQLQPLLMEEGWELFWRVAFRGGDVPEELEGCAREVANACKGLPLGIGVVAAAMINKTTLDDWNTALSFLKNPDPSISEKYPEFRDELYGPLRWSYDNLSNSSLRNCFLYCSMYPEYVKIDVDILVRMWLAEGFINSNGGTYSMGMALGHRNVKVLIDRGLFQNFNFEKQSIDDVNKPVNVWNPRFITVQNVIRDMAIFVGEQENYLSRAGKGPQHFPLSQTQHCKRLSLWGGEVKYLAENVICPELLSLIIQENSIPYKVLESFLSKLSSLRVLDLSNTRLESVPTSLSQLRQLKCLTLKNTLIRSLPEDICNLSDLQFLDLSFCVFLKSLPNTIGKLTQLRYLNLMGSPNLMIPQEISELTSLERLELYCLCAENSGVLKGLTNLMELAVTIISETGEHEIAVSSGTWLEMRHLFLSYGNTVANQDLPQYMQNMKKLQSLRLLNYKGVNKGVNMLKVNLPNWICEFQRLEKLELIGCDQLTELPPLDRLPNLRFLKLKECIKLKYLEIGSSKNPSGGIESSHNQGGFPKLERLDLIEMFYLEAMVSLSSNIFREAILPSLHILKIRMCPKLKRLPLGIEKLPNLKTLIGEDWWWNGMIWEDHNMKISLQIKFKGI